MIDKIEIEVGDIILSENKEEKSTNVYFVTFNHKTKSYEFRCLTCGDVVFSLKDKAELNTEKLNLYIPDISYVIKKEEIVNLINKNFKLKYLVKTHNSLMEEVYNED